SLTRSDKLEIDVTQHVGIVTVPANLRCLLRGIRFATVGFVWPTTTPAYSAGAAWACWLALCCTGSRQASFCGRKPARAFKQLHFPILAEVSVTDFRDAHRC